MTPDMDALTNMTIDTLINVYVKSGVPQLTGEVHKDGKTFRITVVES